MNHQYLVYPQYVEGISYPSHQNLTFPFKNNTYIFAICNVSAGLFPSGTLLELNAIEFAKGSILRRQGSALLGAVDLLSNSVRVRTGGDFSVGYDRSPKATEDRNLIWTRKTCIRVASSKSASELNAKGIKR